MYATNINGTWRTSSTVHAEAGTWRTSSNYHVNIGGTWRAKYVAPPPVTSQTWTAPGTYTFNVPSGKTSLTIEACARGGACAMANDNMGYGGGGGGGGGFIAAKAFSGIKAGEVITVVLGGNWNAYTTLTCAQASFTQISLGAGAAGQDGVNGGGGGNGGTGGTHGTAGGKGGNGGSLGSNGTAGVNPPGGGGATTGSYPSWCNGGDGGGGGSLNVGTYGKGNASDTFTGAYPNGGPYVKISWT